MGSFDDALRSFGRDQCLVKGGYFMGEQEEAANWRRTQEFKKAKAHLAALQSEAKDIGKELGALSSALANSPESISASDGKISFITDIPSGRKIEFPISDLSPERLDTLAKEMRATRNEKDSLFRTIKELGVDIEY